jgi:FeS assembly SUF system protein
MSQNEKPMLPVVGQPPPSAAPDSDLESDTLDGSAPPPASAEELRERVIQVLKGVYDPEIPVNVYDLGLVYDIDVEPGWKVDVKMTLTAPACPVAGTLPPFVETQIRRIPGVSEAKVEIVWDPPWTQDRMSDEAKLQLGLL